MFVRVVLDAYTIRKHMQRSRPSLDLAVIGGRRDTSRVSLADPAQVELADQLDKRRLSSSARSSWISELDVLIDSRWPCLPSGRQLA